jgi:hypothetical protein
MDQIPLKHGSRFEPFSLIFMFFNLSNTITQDSNNQQIMLTPKKWLDELEVMQLMHINDNTLETWRLFKVIAWCNIENITYYDAADIEWLQALSIPVKN